MFPHATKVTTITLDIPGAVMRRAHALYVKYGPERAPWRLKANAPTLECFRAGFEKQRSYRSLHAVETDLGRFEVEQDDDLPTGYVLLCGARIAVLIGPEDGVMSSTD